MKKSLFIVGLLIVGTQVRCMGPASVEEARDEIVKLKKSRADSLTVLQDNERAYNDLKTAYTAGDLTRNRLKTVADNLFKAQVKLYDTKKKIAVEQVRIECTEYAITLLSTIQKLEQKLVELGGEAGEDIVKMQKQLRQAKMPWYKRFYYNYLAPKSKREQVEEMPVYKGMK